MATKTKTDLVGSALRSAPESMNARSALLHVLVAISANGEHPNAHRGRLIAQTLRPDVALLAGRHNDTGWRYLCRAAEKYLAARQAPDLARDLKVATARRLILRLTAPVDWPVADQVADQVVVQVADQVVVRSRFALAIVAADLMAGHDRPEHFEASMMSAAKLAALTGVSESTAARHLKHMVKGGWLRISSQSHRTATRYKMCFIKGGHELDGWAWAPTLATLIGDDTDDLLAKVIQSATHPFWAYTDQGPFMWLTLFADTAGIDPVALGVGRRAVAPLRKRYDLEVKVLANLDQAAAKNGADSRYIAAQERLLEVQLGNRDGQLAHREALGTARYNIDHMLRTAGLPPAPRAQDARTELDGWADKMARGYAKATAGKPNKEKTKMMRHVMTEQLARKGWSDTVAIDTANLIFPEAS